ncbi:MAG: 30S ribosomal protein S20 [Bacteroidales bacterium]|nr:30S ribosomal protein S20 [Bacteroidales bacterium]
MANHKSAEKRMRQNVVRKKANRTDSRAMRNAVKKIRATHNKEEAVAMLPKVTSTIDKLAKKKIIHQNKAANLKSSITKHVNSLT